MYLVQVVDGKIVPCHVLHVSRCVSIQAHPTWTRSSRIRLLETTSAGPHSINHSPFAFLTTTTPYDTLLTNKLHPNLNLEFLWTDCRHCASREDAATIHQHQAAANTATPPRFHCIPVLYIGSTVRFTTFRTIEPTIKLQLLCGLRHIQHHGRTTKL